MTGAPREADRAPSPSFAPPPLSGPARGAAAARAWPAARELFDDAAADPALALASLRDIARANRLLGGTAAALARLDEFFRGAGGGGRAGATLTLLDVGTGGGDIARAARRRAARAGVRLRLVGLDRHAAALRQAARAGELAAVRGDAARLPLGDGAVDLVLCSQLLHHFHGPAVTTVLSELHRVARLGVVVADLRPSPVAVLGWWLISFPLGFLPVTRRDGVTSLRRGFTPGALQAACEAAGAAADVRTHPGFRVTAAWRPRPTGADSPTMRSSRRPLDPELARVPPAPRAGSRPDAGATA